MTRKVTGRILDAPPTWWAASSAPKVVAVAAATMPRGAIQPVNARSPRVSSVPIVANEGHQRAGHQHQDGHQGERRQHQVLERRRCHGGRAGHEQDPDDQLHQCLEERPFGRDVEGAQVRDRQPHQDRGDEPGVIADNVAGGRHPHHARQLGRGGEHITQIKLGRASHSTATPATAPATPMPADSEFAQRVADPAAGARQHGVEHHRAQDAADRVDQRPLPRTRSAAGDRMAARTPAAGPPPSARTPPKSRRASPPPRPTCPKAGRPAPRRTPSICRTRRSRPGTPRWRPGPRTGRAPGPASIRRCGRSR